MFNKTLSDEGMTKIKVVDLGEYYIYLCSCVFEFNSSSDSKFCLKLSFVEIQNLNYSNLVTWKDDQNKSCRSWWVLQLLCSWLFEFK